jgi:subtilase family serine protease
MGATGEEFKDMHRRVLAAIVAATFIVTVGMVASVAQAAPASRSTLAGSAPNWARSAPRLGHANPSAVVGFRVYLGWQGGGAAAALARAVSDPKSASYGQYLTPAQFRQRFAPTQAQVGAVQSWLRTSGFTIDHIPANHHYVAAHGTVAQVESAFATRLDRYSVNGIVVRSPVSDVSVPASLAHSVSGVVGLDDSAVFVHTNRVGRDAPPSAGFRNSPPLSAFWAQFVSPYAYPAGFTSLSVPATAPWSIRGHTPGQIKSAYGISNAYDGTGQTVAIIDAYASPTIRQDVNRWSMRRGLPPMGENQLVEVVAPGTYRRPQNPAQDPQG